MLRRTSGEVGSRRCRFPPGFVEELARGGRRGARAHRARGARDLRLRRPHRLARAAGVRRAPRLGGGGAGRPPALCARAACRSSPAAPARASPAARSPSRTGSSSRVARMNRILEIDLESERVVVEPGVANLDVTRAVAADGYFYAPDPSSQQVCTIGGNVAENSGGAHCLKHGFTVNHVTGREGRAAGRRAARARRQGDRRRRRARPARRGRSAPRGRSGSPSR